MDRAELAGRIDHTLLRQEASSDDIRRLCDEAARWGFHAMCVQPVRAALARRHLDSLGEAGRRVVVCSVAAFPMGSSKAEVVAMEAKLAMDDGAGEVDMVIALGALLEGDDAAVRGPIAAAADVVHARGGLLKVILETAALSDERIRTACALAREGGADFVKTSTGMHPAGGATVRHVRLLKEASGLRVKAAGGIRDLAAALEMIAAGADRIGTSSAVRIMEELGG